MLSSECCFLSKKLSRQSFMEEETKTDGTEETHTDKETSDEKTEE